MLTKEQTKQLFREDEQIKSYLDKTNNADATDEQRTDAKIMRKLIDYFIEEVDKSKKDTLGKSVHTYLETELTKNNYQQ